MIWDTVEAEVAVPMMDIDAVRNEKVRCMGASKVVFGNAQPSELWVVMLMDADETKSAAKQTAGRIEMCRGYRQCCNASKSLSYASFISV